MKRIARVAGLIAIVASVLLIAAGPADARGRGGSGGIGSHGHHGFHGHHRHHGFHPGFRTRVFIGSGVWIGPGWGPYWYPPYYYPPYYPPVYTIPVVAEPTTYIQQSPAPSYWYYCESARAYYPYVQQCPGGWLTVVPPTTTEPQP